MHVRSRVSVHRSRRCTNSGIGRCICAQGGRKATAACHGRWRCVCVCVWSVVSSNQNPPSLLQLSCEVQRVKCSTASGVHIGMCVATYSARAGCGCCSESSTSCDAGPPSLNAHSLDVHTKNLLSLLAVEALVPFMQWCTTYQRMHASSRPRRINHTSLHTSTATAPRCAAGLFLQPRSDVVVTLVAPRRAVQSTAVGVKHIVAQHCSQAQGPTCTCPTASESAPPRVTVLAPCALHRASATSTSGSSRTTSCLASRWTNGFRSCGAVVGTSSGPTTGR